VSVVAPATGAALDRVEGAAKVRGEARYAYEYHVPDVAYLAAVQSIVARGRVAELDDEAALALPGVVAVLWHGNAPRLEEVDDGELAVFQSDRVAYRGQLVAAVVADSPETAQEAAGRVRVEYAEEPHDVLLREGHARLYRPEKVNPNFPTDTQTGNVERTLPCAWTRPTRRRPTTTTPWSPTRRSPSGRATR
jgi:xanthine dehydrogenase YagR molybdenum-binding subunit